MNSFELNIGLKGNKLNVQEIIKGVYEALGIDCIEGFRVDVGEWDGEEEKTLVIKGFTGYNLPIITYQLTLLTEKMGQDALAIASEQYDLLIYNRKFIGKKEKFNNEFFINY